MAEDIERIGFKTADKIALNLGFPTNSKERIDAGIVHTMRTLEDEGHTLGTVQMITENATKLLGVDPVDIQRRIHALNDAKKLIPIKAYDEKNELLGPACQIPATASAEMRIAEAIAQLMQKRTVTSFWIQRVQ